MMTSQQALSGNKVFAAPRAQASSRRGIVAVRAGKYDEELIATATHMTAPGKGLLAIDESNATAGKRLDSIGGEWMLFLSRLRSSSGLSSPCCA